MENKWGAITNDHNVYDIIAELCTKNFLSEVQCNDLIDLIGEIEPSLFLEGIADDTPFPTALSAILKNTTNLGLEVPESLLAFTSNIAIPLLRIEEKQHCLDAIPHGSVAFALLTLIEIMAASSKMGLGNENNVCIVEGAREFAKALFANEDFSKNAGNLLKAYNRLYNKTDTIQIRMQFLLPFEFATAILLDKNTRKTFSSKMRNIKLSENLDDFQKIQGVYFGDCLTEATLQTGEFYKSFFGGPEVIQNYPKIFENILPPDIVVMAEQMNKNCKIALGYKIEQSPKAESTQSKNWIRSGSPIFSSPNHSDDSDDNHPKSP